MFNEFIGIFSVNRNYKKCFLFKSHFQKHVDSLIKWHMVILNVEIMSAYHPFKSPPIITQCLHSKSNSWWLTSRSPMNPTKPLRRSRKIWMLCPFVGLFSYLSSLYFIICNVKRINSFFKVKCYDSLIVQ